MSYVYPFQLDFVLDPYGLAPQLYPLTSDLNGWYVADEATGLAPLHLITERGPLQHGVTYLDFRLDERVISLIVQVQGDTERTYQEHRDHMLKFWTPRQALTALRWYLQDGSQRQIDGTPRGGFSLPRQLIDQRMFSQGQSQRESLEFFCPDPTFYNPVLQGITFSIGLISTGMQVPTPVPTPIGTSLNQTTPINYVGTWQTYPEIRIYGPITDPIITNQTTGDILDFTGTMIAVDELWTIDLRYGYKTVTDQTGVNQIAALSDASNLATWHIKAIDLDLVSQENIIHVSGTAGSAATTIQIVYYERYIGI